MQLGISESLPALVSRRFSAAKEAGHLLFSPTHLTTLHASGIPYQLRYCPALAKKPTSTPKSEKASPGPKFDPFENPSPELLIAQIPRENPTHFLVLNKFPVIPNHFILATTAWKSQTDILEKDDLAAAYACVRAWAEESSDQASEGGRRRLFAFFNSGDESGASQPHRHLQFLPVEAMAQQQSANDDWRPLIDIVSSQPAASGPNLRRLDQVPFAHFVLPLPPNPSSEALFATYLCLYKAAVAATAAATNSGDHHRAQETSSTGPAAISYNLAMTESTMMICPRRSESAHIPIEPGARADVAEAGVVALNGTILAGTLMVKAEAEWNELRRNPQSLGNVLSTIGFPQSNLPEVSLL
ncbi:putative bis(5'-nucleosyl)-tetraphosphatase [Aspergillus homomorphus CBS 101889]|uniref:Putative bis-tetraphosphatase n=1 Tax=Aspergillus homomorphus (strain CBS 101889) TaxID=1450537 RepID=A0A395I038_ASPHC|nr:putative bis-tetraphosphatase [Aspergillus homomorphus CBS 101889]RAL13561.1 putative bis-tetraphosphatase [Aspergillus homomorphus CBS 101889]